MVLYEIPTFPYDQEHKTLVMKIILLIDKLFCPQLKKYVNKVIIVGTGNSAYGIPGMAMKNGLKCSEIPIIHPSNTEGVINLIAVSNFVFYNGYDRMIKGMYHYYMHNNNQEIKFYIVGPDNEVTDKYKKLVKKYKLEKYVILTGGLYGDQLTELYNKCDLAVDSLALHRKNQKSSYELKSREYIARGLPLITATPVDVILDDMEYCCHIEPDESPVDIEKIILFYNNILKNNSKMEIAQKLRKLAYEKFDISHTMKEIIDLIEDCDGVFPDR